MDEDENSEILNNHYSHKLKRKKRDNTKKKIYKPNDNPLINISLKFISFLIIIFLIIYIYQFIKLLLFHRIDIPKEEIKSNNQNNISKIEEKIETSIKQINPEEEVEKFVKSLTKVTDEEMNQFRKMNSEKILFDKTKYKRTENPDVSVVLTMNDQAHCIHKALRSIQNQSLKNIEIIVSIDCSLDNSTETIESFMKEDDRIILVDHDTKVGTMKNRIDAIRKAKGKYITAVDGDDALIQKDILKNALHIANLGNIDIVEFLGYVYVKNEKKEPSIHNHGKVNGIIRQPELRTKFFDVNENYDMWRPIICRTIWGKLIRNDVMKKTIEKIGTKYTDDFILMYEDTIMVITLYQIAQSFYLFREGGYLYSRDEFYGRNPQLPNKQCKIIKKPDRYLDSLIFLNYLYENMADNKIEKQTICQEIISINAYDYSNFTLHLNNNYDMLYRVIDGIIDSQYLTQNEKSTLKQIKSQVMNKENSQNK